MLAVMELLDYPIILNRANPFCKPICGQVKLLPEWFCCLLIMLFESSIASLKNRTFRNFDSHYCCTYKLMNLRQIFNIDTIHISFDHKVAVHPVLWQHLLLKNVPDELTLIFQSLHEFVASMIFHASSSREVSWIRIGTFHLFFSIS